MLNGRNIVFTCALLSLAAPMQSGPLVYVVTGGITGNGAFGTMNVSTGAFTQIGPIQPDGYDGLAVGSNGSLLSLTYAGNVDSINPQTGQYSQIGPSGLGACVIPSPACGPNSAFLLGGSGANLFATDFANNLYGINPSTGAAKLIGATGIAPFPYIPGTENPDGTANLGDEALFMAGGKLYAISDAFVFDFASDSLVKVVTAPTLYQLDPTTAKATVIGSTDLGVSAGVDVNGTVYVFNNSQASIETLNLATGATTPISNFDPSIGLVLGAAPTPEPASYALFLLGGLGLALGARARRRRLQP